ncbi:hypothetical protein [Homoserinimonas hongtaonis]|uniref:hypothetical protein n=1 Tax=Homoserinimonas hongtaonis TaxID=2079791 RepID=UPI00131EF747|nr:hypothetical protein [Salinibacterium hongtaonis]
MPQAVSIITERVRDRVRAAGAGRDELRLDPDAVGRVVREEVRDYSERALAGILPPLGDETQVAREVLASIAGLGPLQHLLDDPNIEDVRSMCRGSNINTRWTRGRSGTRSTSPATQGKGHGPSSIAVTRAGLGAYLIQARSASQAQS